MSDLIQVIQLPVIEERLRSLGESIDRQVEEALSLVCTDETVAQVKKTRAELNTQFKELEGQRLAVKKAILAPYEAFEAIYKECVTSKLMAADEALKQKISDTENQRKAEKRQEVERYFAELCQAKKIDFLSQEQTGVTITLSTSLKKLKEETAAFVERVAGDLEAIRSQQHADEIMVEYKASLNLNRAIFTVADRHRAILREQERAAQPAFEKREEEPAPREEAFSAPVEVKEEQLLVVSFRARGTRVQLKALKQYMLDNGIEIM
ncbi:MAG: DUF1351 domain-containing protein [Lawsonibacter sp.]|nr:DUF1351 domain-containing protein [Lawsonibacter sp.]